jgi:hypothetical protein
MNAECVADFVDGSLSVSYDDEVAGDPVVVEEPVEEVVEETAEEVVEEVVEQPAEEVVEETAENVVIEEIAAE